MLAKTSRPSSTALVMLAKLSSVSTMSDASRATSVPGTAHGDAEVRGAQRGRVVDAVARDRDDLALLLQALDQPQLVLR
jgi:hypothetical protein